MSHTVRVGDVQSQPLAVVRRRASARELKTVVPAACGEVWTAIKAHHVAGAGRHVALYLDEAITLEVGVEISAAFAGTTDLLRSATPAGRVAAVTHLGSYDGLYDAHQAIHIHCRKHGHALAGPNWEIYGHWTDDPAQLRTDVFHLLKASR